MQTNGNYFQKAIESLELPGDQAKETGQNAANIVTAIIMAYGGSAENGIDAAKGPAKPMTGLVYGRIQSGKTRAMIASTAMAFDNGFRIVLVLTSNINDLVGQTHFDFTTGLQGVMTFTKDDDLDTEVQNVKVHLEMGDVRVLLVGSKGKQSLGNIADFLKKVGAEKYPAIIFDDEGDQASLDTNTRKRSQLGGTKEVKPSTINGLIQETLRSAIPRHVYVSVTGTPQAVLLQSADSSNRPSFIVMLPPGSEYIGGDHFFDNDEPEDNPHGLVITVDRNEKEQLLDPEAAIPVGLKRSILFFLVAAAAAVKNEGIPKKGYSYLCHPSLKNKEQGVAKNRINDFLTKTTQALHGDVAGEDILREVEGAHRELAKTLKERTPSLEETKKIILEQLATRRLLVINAKVKRQGIAYGNSFNFLIGGNTLGRGIAIRDLLVTYYIRDSKMSQIDTMHQHARMFGYRKKTLLYTRLYVPRHLYYRFRDIHQSDRDLRAFVEEKIGKMPTTFPIEYSYDLKTTRAGVLDVNKTDSLRPGMHVYPNYIVVPQKRKSYLSVMGALRQHFGLASTTTAEQMDGPGQKGKLISTKDAIALVRLIKTRSQNTWRDRTIGAVLEKLSVRLGDKVVLKFRTADRVVREGGFMSTGTLAGDRLEEARQGKIPKLWIMSVKSTPESQVGGGQEFMYPSLVIPESLPKLYMFNRG